MRLPLQNESVDMCMTSPPYWALRKYASQPLVWDDGWRGELGLEPTFELYIKHLCDIFDEVKRVLKKEGTVWVNMGDTYGGGGQGGSNYGGKETTPERVYPKVAQKLQPKSLCLIPMRFAIEMCNRGWILRNVCIWKKPNCMPSSANDRFTVDFEYIFLFAKNRRYYFEQQFEELIDRERLEHRMFNPDNLNRKQQYDGKSLTGQGINPKTAEESRLRILAQGRNKRCVWTIPTEPYPEAHFATFPQALCETPIKAGCPEFVCRECGKGREVIVDVKRKGKSLGPIAATKTTDWIEHGKRAARLGPNVSDSREFVGLTDCDCNAGFAPGIVLDPFAGSGTTGLVCQRLGRQFVGVDLSMEYLKMAQKRMAQRVLV